MQLRGLSFLCHMLRHVPPWRPFLMRFLCHFCIWPHHTLFYGLRCSMIGIHQCKQTWNRYLFCTHRISWHGLLPIPTLQKCLVCSLGCRVGYIPVHQDRVRICAMVVLHGGRCVPVRGNGVWHCDKASRRGFSLRLFKVVESGCCYPGFQGEVGAWQGP